MDGRVQMMRLASVLTPMSDENLTLAAQCGVTDIVGRYPGPNLDDFVRMKQHIESFGMRLAAIEGYLPIEQSKLGRDDGREIAEMKTLLANMKTVGVPLLCYNFMAGTDWVRTRVDLPERGGAKVTGFRLAEVQQAMSLNGSDGIIDHGPISADQLWRNLESFLRALIPAAEAAGVTMCMHPDDPPLPELLGKARIMNCVESFERLVNLVPSPSNAICFCQGTFATMGVDIPATILRLGRHIRYIHFRDVRGNPESFVETFHDNGVTDMAAAMRAYRQIGYSGPIRPDHVPQMLGEDDGEPGYTMLGRLFAYGYIRGLMQSTK
jgi:mannonate dehydratase